MVAQAPDSIRLNQARVTCLSPNPCVVSASFESSIFASVSEQKRTRLEGDPSFSFESVSLASSTLGAATRLSCCTAGNSLDHVDNEVTECHLVGAGFVAEFVGGHGFNRRNGVFLRPVRISLRASLTGFLPVRDLFVPLR